MSDDSKSDNCSLRSDQAAYWVVQINACRLAPKDVQRLADWLRQSPENHEVFYRYARTWLNAGNIFQLNSLDYGPFSNGGLQQTPM